MMIYADVNMDMKEWPCIYGPSCQFNIMLLDEDNDPSKEIWSGPFYANNNNMNTFIKKQYNL